MTMSLSASISIDGKLLGTKGKPLRRGIPASLISEALELELTIHPIIVGDETIPTLSGLPGVFLEGELRWELLSAVKGQTGKTAARYRRKRFKAKRA